MYEDYELDLKFVFYQGAKKWRKMIVIGIITAIFFSIYKTNTLLSVYFDKEKYEVARNEYKIISDEHEAKGTALANEIVNIKKTIDRQEAYNENSILMKIDPFDEYVGTVSLFIDSGYLIMPELTYQNVDKTKYILSAYEGYMNDGELINKILEKSTQIKESRYLKEILNIEINGDTLTIILKNTDEKSCIELISLIKSGLEEKTLEIKQKLGEYEYSILNESYYSTVDLSLDEYQRYNEQYVADLVIELAEKNDEYKEWKISHAPKFIYQTNNIVKSVIKSFVIGGVIGGVISFIWYAFKSAITDTVLSAGEIKKRFNILILGEIPKRTKKKSFIDNKIATLFGETKLSESTSVCNMIFSNINAILSGIENKTVGLIGDLEDDSIMELLKNIEKNECGASVEIIGDILNSAEAINMAQKVDYVILVETQGKSKYTQISEEIERLHIWKKELLGVIVRDVDGN